MAKIKVTTIEGLANSIDGLKIYIDKRFNVVDKKLDGLQQDFENLNEITSNSFDNLEAHVATKSELNEIKEKVERIDIRVDEIHEVTVGLEQGELQTGKSMRKMQKIVNRLSHETR